MTDLQKKHEHFFSKRNRISNDANKKKTSTAYKYNRDLPREVSDNNYKNGRMFYLRGKSRILEARDVSD